MRYLRQSTTVTVTIGPFLDSTDGVTAEDGLAGTMTVQIAKAGAAFANRNSATAIAFDADGFYRVELNTTDTATGGPLVLKSRVAGAAPVWHEFTIMAAARYDLAILGTGVQPVNLTQIDGNATNTNAATLFLRSLNIVNNAGSALIAQSSGGNGHGIATNGNGIGHGINIFGGSTGHGVQIIGGSTSGDAIRGTATSGAAFGDALVDSILDRAITEPSAIWAWPATLRKVIGWIGALSRNKITQTNTLQTVRNDADAANIATSTHGDDGSVHTRGEFS